MILTNTIRFACAILVSGSLALPIAFAVQDEKKEDRSAEVAELIQDARQSLGSEDFADAAETLAKVVKLDPKNALGWQLHGYALHADGKLDKAIKSHLKASEFEQTKGIALYNLGCAYSLKKDKTKALDFLDKAVDAGFMQVSFFETDPDLDNIRKEDRFVEIVKVVKNGGRDQDDKKKEETSDKKADKVSIVGKWKVTKGMRAGEDLDGERLPPEIVISKKTITLPVPGAEPFVFSYEIDSSKKPIALDMEIESGPAPEGTALAIIKMDKNTLTLCYDPFGQTRPEKFKTSEDNGFFMFVMEMVEKDKGADKKDKKDKEADK